MRKTGCFILLFKQKSEQRLEHLHSTLETAACLRLLFGVAQSIYGRGCLQQGIMVDYRKTIAKCSVIYVNSLVHTHVKCPSCFSTMFVQTVATKNSAAYTGSLH